jgi:hypothetical protein
MNEMGFGIFGGEIHYKVQIMLNKIFFLLLIILSNTCYAQKDSINIDISPLFKCWTSSREENEKGSLSKIYRPCDFKKFQPSWFRARFEFKENGECSWLHLAENDAHYMIQGNWSYDKEQQILIIKDKSEKIIYSFKVISIATDLFKIESIIKEE